MQDLSFADDFDDLIYKDDAQELSLIFGSSSDFREIE